ncbi:hypothetical protein P7K49_010181 [Saguinus oedipus]|uniref:DH domain-containing protein n=1 Tax=Saguinus oedipus TaxID=9490 RepID=A0ABQ9VM25_SAGOE|nr:hypothetical protein P7K49_010181 [Saguinus oedipus]
MKPLKATATTSQPVLTIQQIETIFYKVQDIYQIHKEFYDSLCPKVQQWDSQVTMGHLFQKLVSPGKGGLTQLGSQGTMGHLFQKLVTGDSQVTMGHLFQKLVSPRVRGPHAGV